MMNLIERLEDERLPESGICAYDVGDIGLRMAIEDVGLLRYSLRASLAREANLRARLAALEKVESGPWPLTDVVDKLAAFATMMLRERNYDGDGWESLQVAAQTAPHLVKQFRAALAPKAGE